MKKPLPPQFQPTKQQVLGPYYLPNSPLKNKLYPAQATGSALSISGQVLSSDCQPLVGATIHVWLADPQGRYDNQDDQGAAHRIPPEKQLYRGRMVTDGVGRYTFQCLRSGNYFDEGADLWRPAHIHVKVEAPGYRSLVTQLYFQNDAHNTHDIPGDDFFHPELALQLHPAIPMPGVTQEGIFNFVLEKKS